MDKETAREVLKEVLKDLNVYDYQWQFLEKLYNSRTKIEEKEVELTMPKPLRGKRASMMIYDDAFAWNKTIQKLTEKE